MPRPEVKTPQSVTDKINRRRRAQAPGEKPFDIEDVQDLVGAKVLCAYLSDVEAVLTWLFRQRSCHVTPTRKLAREEMEQRERDRGYRAYHFTLTAKESTGPKFPFELQVKTLIEEAWDAKTHDVSYKPASDIDVQLLDHMQLLSRALGVIDLQSEVLKSQIQLEQTERALHQRAAVLFILSTSWSDEAKKKLQEIGFPTNYSNYKINNSPKILRKIKNLQKSTSMDDFLCRAYTLLAILDERAEYRMAATTAVDNLTAQEESYNNCRIASHVHWALGNYHQAIRYSEMGVAQIETELAELSEEDYDEGLARELREAKNQFIYWVCEARAEEKSETASQYTKELDSDSLTSLDTLGFFKIVFGSCSKEVDEGRTLIRRAREEAKGEETAAAEAFYLKHDYLARKRLDERFRLRSEEAGIYGGPKSG